MKKRKKISQEDESIKKLSLMIEAQGYSIRREKLSRGPSFRVKSGGCFYSGDKVIFIDKNLPEDQQITMLLNFILDLNININEDDLEGLSPTSKELLMSRLVA